MLNKYKQYAKFYAKRFAFIISFNPHIWGGCDYNLQYTEKEIDD